MTPKSLPTLIIFSFLFLGGVSARCCGFWEPITNLNAPEVQEIAKFAVTEQNKEAKSQLVFESVKFGEQQVVSGINYRLVIVATDKGAKGKYEAVVYDQSWTHTRKLTSFKKL